MSFVDVDIKKAFFDRQKIVDAVDRQTRRALSRAGAIVRRSQRQSIKRRVGSSRPGQPPRAHSTHPVKTPKYILFGFDARTDTVVIGMVKLNASKADGDKPLPGLWEVGGYLTQKKGTWVRGKPGRDNRGRYTQGGLVQLKQRRRVHVRPRPSSVPALKREIAAGKVIAPWKNVVTP